MFGGISFNKKNEQQYENVISEFEMPNALTVPIIYSKDQKNSVLVAKGDKVKAGTLISKAENVNAVNIYSPISGKVAGIVERYNEVGELLPFVVIANDRLNNQDKLSKIIEISQINIIKRMSDAGIIDMETKKPCHLKYLTQVDRKIHTLVVNCVEVAPYVNTKIAVLDNFTEQVLIGVKYMAIASNVDKVIFVFSQNDMRYSEKIRQNEQILQNVKVEYITCAEKYPADNYKLITKKVLGISLKEKEDPTMFGMIIENPLTAFSLQKAVDEGVPFYENYVTIYAKEGNFIQNVKMPNGTTIESISDNVYGESVENDIKQVVLNGILDGVPVTNFQLSVGVFTRAVFFLSENESKFPEEMPCIYCNKCVNICPMKLMPMQIDKALANDNVNTAVESGARTCISCGCCSYVCPSRRQILQRINVLKNNLKGTINE